MSTILDTIAGYAKERVAADKKAMPPDRMRELAAALAEAEKKDPDAPSVPGRGGEAFYAAIRREGMRFICEVKKASPSKGVIDPVFPYRDIAAEYEAAGADAISCLTESRWFLGSDDIFREIRSAVRTPMLRKDFVVDEYQLWQAKVMGADCVLLICALLDTKTLARYLGICEELGLAVLTEAHDEAEIASAAAAGARMIGVNNRNLKDFSVNLENALRLRDCIPPGSLYVAESGVNSPQDAALLKAAGADAILMGEVLMRAADKKAVLTAMREAAS